MVASASLAVVAGVASSTGVVMTSRIETFRGSRSASDRRRSTSRSVKIPATRWFSSITATAPTCRSSIVRMACSAVASTGTEAASGSHISRIFIAHLPGSRRFQYLVLQYLVLRGQFVLEHLAILHHKTDILKNPNICRRIARNGDHICIGARRDYAQPALHLQQF